MAASPVAKATAPMTTALAASTAPRRGVAASVVRMRPRRYSVLKNMAATTTIAISPANAPVRLCSIVTVGNGPRGPGVTGARSPEPVSVKRPAFRVKGTGPLPGPGPVPIGPPPPIAVPAQVRPGAAPARVTWSKTPVAWAGTR